MTGTRLRLHHAKDGFINRCVGGICFTSNMQVLHREACLVFMCWKIFLCLYRLCTHLYCGPSSVVVHTIGVHLLDQTLSRCVQGKLIGFPPWFLPYLCFVVLTKGTNSFWLQVYGKEGTGDLKQRHSGCCKYFWMVQSKCKHSVTPCMSWC